MINILYTYIISYSRKCDTIRGLASTYEWFMLVEEFSIVAIVNKVHYAGFISLMIWSVLSGDMLSSSFQSVYSIWDSRVIKNSWNFMVKHSGF